VISLPEVRRWCRSLGADHWSPAPQQVEEFLAAVLSDDAQLCAMLAWTADLTTLGGVSAQDQARRLGAELSALSRMLAESIPGAVEHRKAPDTYWHIVGRGPHVVQLVACARWLIYRRSGRSVRASLSIESEPFVADLCNKDPRLREFFDRF